MLWSENLMLGGLAAIGAFAYNLWGFLEAYQATKNTPEVESFDWLMTVMTVVPSIIAGFAAGYAINPANVELSLVITAGYAAADVGHRLGVNSFFRRKD